jgi:phosphoribosylanthranilate isomerase
MWVKICATTNVEDALLAARAGASAVGFVFAEQSARRVTAEQVAEMSAALRDRWDFVERIGVFSSAELQAIPEIVADADLTGVQLHFGYSAYLVEYLRKAFGERFRIIQTNHWRVGGQTAAAFRDELTELSEAAGIDNVLVDSRTAVADGGTGVAFDWEAARESLSALGEKPLIVAGGLTPGNVAEAIRILRPSGVDVASGVEASVGKKDAAKVRAFVEKARGKIGA